LKKKVERAVQKIRNFCAKMKRKMEKKRETITREKVIIATAVREKTKETHSATLNGLEKELVGLEEIHEEKQKETHEKVAGYTEEIKGKEKEIERLGSEIEGINKRIENGGPEPMYEMNTALMCFIIALLVLRDNIHAYFDEGVLWRTFC
jgi:vacuolar-type H+-ATPase subunit I/STV1